MVIHVTADARSGEARVRTSEFITFNKATHNSINYLCISRRSHSYCGRIVLPAGVYIFHIYYLINYDWLGA
jgi:hypothetical protein